MTINATALTANTLTLAGSAAATVTLGTAGSLAAGADTGNLTVTGGSGVNTIAVGSGNNTITGGGGADVLTGGSGVTSSSSIRRPTLTVAARDSINNFVHGSDLFDTSAIAGITTIQGLITGPTQIAAHSIASIQSGADTIVYANSTGAAENQAAADMGVTLKSILASVSREAILSTSKAINRNPAASLLGKCFGQRQPSPGATCFKIASMTCAL